MANWNVSSLLSEDHDHLLHPLYHPDDHTKPHVWVKGKGAVLIDAEGREYIDGLACLWNVNVGHGRRELAEAAAEQMSTLAYSTNMQEAVLAHASKAHAVIMAAAVADYKPQAPAKKKIKKQGPAEPLTLELASTPDILLSLGEKKKKGTVLVGFALETDNELQNAQDKLKKKNLDFIVLNSLKEKGAGFGTYTNVVTIVPRDGRIEKLPLMSKFDVANEILNRLTKLL